MPTCADCGAVYDGLADCPHGRVVSHDAPTTLRSTIDKVRALIGRQGVDPSGFGIFESGNFVGVFVKPGYRVPDIALPDHLDGFRIVECEAPG